MCIYGSRTWRPASVSTPRHSRRSASGSPARAAAGSPADELFVSPDGPLTAGLHFALQASDRETVERFHEAALGAGGRDNGVPGERDYHPGYSAAYVLDPDGTNVEAVFHGPVHRSAASVEISWDE